MDLFDRLVNETVSTGIEPVSLKYTAIYDCYTADTVAYTTETELFSSASGVISDLGDKLANEDISVDICFHGIAKAIRFIKKTCEADGKLRWVAVKGTEKFLTQNDLCAALEKLFKEKDFSATDKLCIDFSESILNADRKSVIKGIADLKVLGIKTTISGITANSPLTALSEVNADAAVLSSELTGFATDRNKPAVFSSLVRLLKAMDVAVIADGVRTDDEIRELNKCECMGFIPAKEYSGKFPLIIGKQDKKSVEM